MYKLYKELLAGGKILALITILVLIIPASLFLGVKEKAVKVLSSIVFAVLCLYMGMAIAGFNVTCVESCREAGTYSPWMYVMVFAFCIILMLVFAVKGGLAAWTDIDNGSGDGNRVVRAVGIFSLLFATQFVGLIVFAIRPELVDVLVSWVSSI